MRRRIARPECSSPGPEVSLPRRARFAQQERPLNRPLRMTEMPRNARYFNGKPFGSRDGIPHVTILTLLPRFGTLLTYSYIVSTPTAGIRRADFRLSFLRIIGATHDVDRLHESRRQPHLHRASRRMWRRLRFTDAARSQCRADARIAARSDEHRCRNGRRVRDVHPEHECASRIVSRPNSHDLVDDRRVPRLRQRFNAGGSFVHLRIYDARFAIVVDGRDRNRRRLR